MARVRSKPRSVRRPVAGAARRRAPRGPRELQSVIAYLAVEGGAQAIKFYERAFGAKVIRRNDTPEGMLMHASLRIGNSVVMLSDVFPGSPRASPAALGNSPVTLHLNATRIDAQWARAIAAGARVEMALENQFWGERYGQLVDPFGHRWSMSQAVKMTPAERKAAEAKAMARMADRASA